MSEEKKRLAPEEMFLKLHFGFVDSGLMAVLGPDLVITLLAIVRRMNKHFEAYPSYKDIAEHCGCNENTVSKRVKKLLAFRWNDKPILVVKSSRSRYGTTTYSLARWAQITLFKDTPYTAIEPKDDETTTHHGSQSMRRPHIESRNAQRKAEKVAYEAEVIDECEKTIAPFVNRNDSTPGHVETQTIGEHDYPDFSNFDWAALNEELARDAETSAEPLVVLAESPPKESLTLDFGESSVEFDVEAHTARLADEEAAARAKLQAFQDDEALRATATTPASVTKNDDEPVKPTNMTQSEEYDWLEGEAKRRNLDQREWDRLTALSRQRASETGESRYLF